MARKRGKKPQQAQQADHSDDDVAKIEDVPTIPDGPPKMKTAAEKKAEKKLRQKANREAAAGKAGSNAVPQNKQQPQKKKQQRKQYSSDEESESESESEEEVQPKKKQQPAKKQPPAKKQQRQQYSSDEESETESESEEEVKPKKQQPAKKQPAKKPPQKKQQRQQYSDSETETETETESEEEIKPKKGKQAAPPQKKGPQKKAPPQKKQQRRQYSSDESDSEDDYVPPAKGKGGNQKKKVETLEPQFNRMKTPAEKKAEKKAAEQKARQLANQKKAAQQQKQQQQQQSKKKQQRPQYSSDESESETESEEEVKKPAPKAQQPQKKQPPQTKQQRQQYSSDEESETESESESEEEVEEEKVEKVYKKRVVYAKKKKTPVPKVETPVEEEKPKEEEKKEEVAESWEDDVVDDWENIESSDSESEKEEEKSKEAEVPKEEEKPKEITKAAASGKKGAKGKEAKEDEPTMVIDQVEDKNEKPEDLRSPICCVLGHVDTGKTKLLDNIRSTNVQDGEAGGITQQIGATFIPTETLQQKTAVINKSGKMELKVPGLLIIDTPGHESFSNLRLRGSSLCDIAILVIDIQHGLEQQTLESIKILKKRKTPFVVALNKIDVCFEWEKRKNSGFRASLKSQKKAVQEHFHDLTKKVILQLAEQGLNSALYYENKDLKKVVSLVPTSAHSGEGIPDLLGLIVQVTQRWMANRITFKENVECTVLEVKKVQGLGTTIDVILSQGAMKQGDTIVLCGLDGPIVTTVRELLMPQPLRELRVKSQYVSHRRILAAQGVKIFAKKLENAVAGTQLYVVPNGDEKAIEEAEKRVKKELETALNRFDTTETGVCAQASTLGALEALLVFFEASNIPVSSVDIGPVHKRQVVKCSTQKDELHSCILSFDVPVDPEAALWAKQNKVTIFTADIIYHLFDRYIEFRKTIMEKRKEAVKHLAWFPCRFEVLPDAVFRNRDPLILGVNILEGTLKRGVPIVVPSKGFEELGVIDSIQVNTKDVTEGKIGQSVCVRIQNNQDAPRMYGRHFDHTNTLCTKVSRKSIDVLKEHFRDEMTKDDWKLILKMKKEFGVM